MKKNKELIKILSILSVISFIIYTTCAFYEIKSFLFFFNGYIIYGSLPDALQNYILDLSLGIFGGAIISLLISFHDYLKNKDDDLNRIADILCRYINLFRKVPFYYTKPFLDDDDTINSESFQNDFNRYVEFYKETLSSSIELRRELSWLLYDMDFFDKENNDLLKELYGYLNDFTDNLSNVNQPVFSNNKFTYQQIKWINQIEDFIFDIRATSLDDDKYHEIMCYNLFAKKIDNYLDKITNLLIKKKHKKGQSDSSEKKYILFKDIGYCFYAARIKIKNDDKV